MGLILVMDPMLLFVLYYWSRAHVPYRKVIKLEMHGKLSSVCFYYKCMESINQRATPSNLSLFSLL
ncbi:hypothetical protein ZEAMMB73_Zm00001d021552 [Zea mays]|uniref:Uncharacterized protein n=1 Tax=Zea mays TaxID=4577 RepID=A0A1D6IC37_MAIZE|nr:hypothetical protein ZEAMMB73_Zm00001d021552 [Zea mays]